MFKLSSSPDNINFYSLTTISNRHVQCYLLQIYCFMGNGWIVNTWIQEEITKIMSLFYKWNTWTVVLHSCPNMCVYWLCLGSALLFSLIFMCSLITNEIFKHYWFYRETCAWLHVSFPFTHLYCPCTHFTNSCRYFCQRIGSKIHLMEVMC